MNNDNTKVDKNCFVKCQEGHRAFKVPGEKHTYFCSDCELKFTSDVKPYYAAQFDKKPKKPGKKRGPKPKVKSNLKKKLSAGPELLAGPKLKAVHSCNLCFHRTVCYLIKKLPKNERAMCICTYFYLDNI